MHTVSIQPGLSSSKIRCHVLLVHGAWSCEERGAQTGHAFLGDIEVVQHLGERDGAALWTSEPGAGSLGPKMQKAKEREGRRGILAASTTPSTRGSAGWPPKPLQLTEHVASGHRPLPLRPPQGPPPSRPPPSRPPPAPSAELASGSSTVAPVAEAHLRVVRRRHPLPSSPQGRPPLVSHLQTAASQLQKFL